MKAILQTYRDRLINLSGRNRSLVLRKIHKKRSFDLGRLLPFIEDLDKTLIDFLLNREKNKKIILQDPYRVRNEALKALDKRNQEERKKEMLALEETMNGLTDATEEEHQVLQNRKQAIQEKYDMDLIADKKSLDDKIDTMTAYSNHINYLLREINAVEKETGKYELYLGYPFVEGRCNDQSFVRAPLFLFPIKLEKVSNRWQLSNMVEQEVLINKVFIFAYAKFNDVKVTDIETEYASLECFTEDVITGLLHYLDDNKIHIVNSGSRAIETFKDYTNATIPTYQAGELQLKNYMVMGQFPLSNSIYTDYQIMEQEDLYNHALESLLMNKKEVKDAEAFETQTDGMKENKTKPISEKEVYFLSSLDHSQENAVQSVNDQHHMVIYGPPGTGKSQTIANIICDALAKGKRVLMVSQKRAALDVIYNRLADINTKIALVHDHNKDKKNFYKKVCDCVDHKAMDYDPSLNLKIDDTATAIDEKVSYLEKIGGTLHEERAFGISLYEMYTKTQAITSTQDPRYHDYRLYRKENPFQGYTFHELDEAKSHLVQNTINIKAYMDYQHKRLENPMYAAFDRLLDFVEIQDLQDHIMDILDMINQHKDDIDMEDYQTLGLLYKQQHFQVSQKDIEQYAKDVNHKRHGHLVEEDEDNKWWNPGFWLHHRDIKETREKNAKQYAAHQDVLTNRFSQYGQWNNAIIQKWMPLQAMIREEDFNTLRHRFVTEWDISKTLEDVQAAAGHLDVYIHSKNRVDSLSHLEVKMLDYAMLIHDQEKVLEEQDPDNTRDQEIEHGRALEDKIQDTLENIVEFSTLMAIHEVEKTKEYNEFYLHFSMYDDMVSAINHLMEEKNGLTSALIKSKWNDQLQLFIDTPVFKEFKRQAEKKRKLWPIRKYVIEFRELLLTVFPCWLLSPETVSDILPLAEGMFDMVIFDEASQMYVENAIPAIYRGKKVVVTGDDKQLKPSAAFMSRYDDYDEEMTTIETAAAFEEESLLDLAKVNYPDVHLNYHYRSRYEELINFSNYAFYNGQLNISPNIENSGTHRPSPIERIKVEGKWIERKNNTEASKVVDLVDDILRTRKHDETIGIITFNVTQKDLISDLLDARGNYDKDFRKRYQEEINRKKGNEDVSLFVKNIENVQGDERDIIIFSIGYAPNEEGRLSVNFGALSQDGGENRLNVAISRAKQKVYVITSIEPEALKVEETKNRGAKLFKQYLQYAKEIAIRDEKASKQVLEQLVLSDKKRESGLHEDGLIEQMYRRLKKDGYQVKKHVGVSDYKIDLALYDEDKGGYLLGIECDGTSYREQSSTRERDIHRKRFLAFRGWHLMRIWSLDWWKDSEQVIQNIKDGLEAIKEQLGNEDIPHSDKIPLEGQEKTTMEAVTPVHPELTIWFGDKAYIQDNMSKEMFEIEMEPNPYHKDTMNPFCKDLLGRRIEERFVYQDYEYKVVGIDKK
ncbi:DUF4011 domain-containing protein [Vallitalea pronyensis]|uniref:DUF4011 domain-containing protein n=1 Tax=Vallitalea pronyensis TaxID=1348613 RepID=A0A8J8SFC6_9FIRM|nr:AAA domain-containing protein [Vallitalea pronyensis]QUI21209.1 DUF4011 domain-containing protein [Vallitalea pronyensis]